jgi:hypothetical protein
MHRNQTHDQPPFAQPTNQPTNQPANQTHVEHQVVVAVAPQQREGVLDREVLKLEDGARPAGGDGVDKLGGGLGREG